MTAMELTDTSLQGLSAAVLGYGRIGKALSRLLRGLGVAVTVCAKREEALSEAAAEGYTPLLLSPAAPLGGFSSLRKGFPLLFNTVPARILPRELLLSLDTGTLLIDLASSPFGVSDEDVQETSARSGLRYLRAPSLPGSYAPRTAGEIISDCILKGLSRRDIPLHPHDNGGTLP
jgi:dipicolinate synthase subunit A